MSTDIVCPLLPPPPPKKKVLYNLARRVEITFFKILLKINCRQEHSAITKQKNVEVRQATCLLSQGASFNKKDEKTGLETKELKRAPHFMSVYNVNYRRDSNTSARSRTRCLRTNGKQHKAILTEVEQDPKEFLLELNKQRCWIFRACAQTAVWFFGDFSFVVMQFTSLILFVCSHQTLSGKRSMHFWPR